MTGVQTCALPICGGLDAFLAKAKDEELSADALKIKKDISKAQAAA